VLHKYFKAHLFAKRRNCWI